MIQRTMQLATGHVVTLVQRDHQLLLYVEGQRGFALTLDDARTLGLHLAGFITNEEVLTKAGPREPQVSDEVVDAFLSQEFPDDPERLARIKALFDLKLRQARLERW